MTQTGFIASSVIALTLLNVNSSLALLQAGASSQIITPSNPTYLAGLRNNRLSQGVHDDLFARCLILDDGKTQVGFVSTDLIGLTSTDITEIRNRAKLIGSSAENVIITATHQHSGPDTIGLWGKSEYYSGVDLNYTDFLYNQIASAIKEARDSLEPAEISFGSSQIKESDQVSRNAREPNLIDRKLGIIKVDNNHGKTIATIVNFTAHPEIMWSENLLLTAEYPGVVYRECDEKIGGITLFINGALGGMITTDNQFNTFEEVERIGGIIAQKAIEAAKSAEKQVNPKIQHSFELLEIPLENQHFHTLIGSGILPKEMLINDNIHTEVHLIEIGNAQIATFPGEVLPKLGFRIKNNMTSDYNFIFGLANNELGYILATEDYEKKLYKYEKSMSIGSQIGPITTNALVELLRK
ncbi:hypothetical protein CMK22_09220 [Candidatus Poribacteria bacterium]|nr:hypothetical protein [Candidatus Poribacteria bacterium]